MVIRIPSTQIPEYWETIKFCVAEVDEIDEKDLQSYFIKLLLELLGDKAQCFMRADDETREIMVLMITRITENRISGNKIVYIQCLYSFKRVPIEVWREELGLLTGLADKESCLEISFDSRNPKAWKLARAHGFKEKHRSFTYDLGGI